MYNRFWLKITDIFQASLFGRAFIKFVHCLSNAFHASWFYSFFCSKSMSDYAENSKLLPFIRKTLFKTKFTDFVANSVFVWIFSEMPQSFFSFSVSLLSVYMLPAGILMFALQFGNVTNMIISAIIIIIGVILVGFKTTIGNVVSNSFLLRSLCNFFFIDIDQKPTKSYNKRFYAVTLVFGLIVGFLTMLLGFKIGLLAFAVFLFFPVLIASPILMITLAYTIGIVLSSLPAFFIVFFTLVVVLCRLFKGIEQLPKLRSTYILVLLYIGLTMYYTFAGFAGSDSLLFGFIQLVMLTVFFSVVVVINEFEKFKRLIYSLSVITWIPSVVGIYQFLTGQGGTEWTEENYVGGLARITSTFLNPNVYGEFLIFSICITLTSLLITKTIKGKTFFAITLLLEAFNLGVTYSRGCYISVVFAIFIVIWCCDKRLFSFGIFAIPVLPKVLPENVISRILSVGSYFKDTSTLYRFSIWRGAMSVIKNHWFVGCGIGTAAFSLFYQNYMITAAYAQHAHNTYMEIAIEMSIFGLILFLMILLYTIKDVSNVMKTSNLKAKFMVIPLIASFGGVMIQSFFDHIFYNNVVFMVYWLTLGLTIAALNIITSDKNNSFLLKEGK